MPGPTLQFPTNLQFGSEQSLNAFMSFTAKRWSYDTTSKKNQEIKVSPITDGSAAMPITEGLVDSQAINWEVTEGVGAAGLKQMLVKSGLDILRGLNQTVTKTLEAKKGITTNDLASLTFGLSEFRDFTFTFKMIPRNQADAIRITEIIRFFKERAVPDFTTNVVLYPRFFTIRAFLPSGITGDLFEQLLVFKSAVITNISVNYFPEGTLTFYRDGAPTAVQLELSMKELQRVSGGDYSSVAALAARNADEGKL
jgi:hypothetical protein